MEQLGKASEWGQYGGILGLVIFALFFILGAVLVAVLWRFNNSEEKRQQFFEKLLTQHEKEREGWQKIAIESNEAITTNARAFADFRHELTGVTAKIVEAMASRAGK